MTYLMVFVIIIAINGLYQFKSLLFDPQIIQDGGINFLKYAMKYGITSIPFPDAGYLPLFQRVVCLTIYELFPIQYYAFIVNISFSLRETFTRSGSNMYP